MKQHIEIITKVKSIKEIQTKTGKWMYSFSVPVSKMVGEEQKTEWVQVTILQEQQRPDLKDTKEVHFIGQLSLKEEYKQYPQSVMIFGFYIEPVLNQVYRQRKTRNNTENTTQNDCEGHNTSAGGMNAPSDVQKRAYEQQQGQQFPDMSDGDNSVPF